MNEAELKPRPVGTNVRKIILAIFLILVLLVFIHPKLLNLRLGLGSYHEPVQMNYVTDFFLWTRQTPHTFQRLVVDHNELVTSSFLLPRKTYIIIHGFTCSGLDNWIIQMKNAFLLREDCNVISVNWQAGSMTAGYYVIQERVPYVGQDIATLIDFLQHKMRLTSAHIHLVGHSLGAHVAAFTGKIFAGNLARITGLDPAGLAFRGGSHSRLDKSDAQFVDVIHTHGCFSFIQQWTDCFGTYDNLGHADFWPNGGEHQGACDPGGDGDTLVREGSNCHHGLAYVYYTESISSYPTSTRFAARKCDTWSMYNNGSCSCKAPTQYMGYNVNPSIHGVFYLNTSNNIPYGLLDPGCNAAQMSILKLTGTASCLLLVLYGFLLACVPDRKRRNGEKHLVNLYKSYLDTTVPVENDTKQ